MNLSFPHGLKWTALTPLILVSCTLPAREPDFSKVKIVLQEAVNDGAFPGCSAAVGSSKGSYWQGGFGKYAKDGKTAEKLSLSTVSRPGGRTLYDLASLTKVVGTTSVIIALVQKGKLALDDKVAIRLPGFAPASLDKKILARRNRVTIRHLLLHTSGLPGWKPLYRTCKSYRKLLNAILPTALEAEPGSRYRYSDLGFILLGEIAARAGRKPIARLEKELVFAPLGMKETRRNPSSTLKKRIPPTEFDEEKGSYIHGKVHDENARAAGGITGHAGLFSTTSDLSLLARELLLALKGKSRKFRQKTIESFVRCQDSPKGSSRALGWDTPSEESSAGDLASRTSFGHTGFTGTSIWIDPQRDLYIILLSNRVHPTRKNRKITAVRRKFADAVVGAIDSAGKKAR